MTSNTQPPLTRWLLYLIVIAIAVGISAIVIHRVLQQPPAIMEVSVSSSVAGKKDHIKLPYSVAGEADEKLDFTIDMNYKPGNATLFYVVPDDCVDIFTVNREKVKLTPEANEQRCNWQSGFAVDLKPYLQTGMNRVFIQVVNKSGKAGLRFSTDMDIQ